MLSARPVNLSSDTHYLSFKTPGRGVRQSRLENANAGIQMTLRKGKDTQMPKTPFQGGSIREYTRLSAHFLSLNIS